jgi:Putative Actinobacterial Holin-X, holin superfamily III
MLDEKTRRTDEVSDLLDTVKTYAVQETVGPLKGGVKAMALGLAGVFCLGLGIIFILIAILRVLQTETDAFHGDLMSVLPYLIVLTVAVAAILLAIALIKRIDMRPREERP